MKKITFILVLCLSSYLGFAQNMYTIGNINLPRGLSIDASGNVYVSETPGNIYKINTSGVETVVAGTSSIGYSGDGGQATSAELNSPQDVAVDMYGNLFIADEENNVIRKVTASTGIISTVAGNGIGGYNGDGIVATSAQIANPTGVTVDVYGNIYIADYENNRIRKVTASTGIISTVAGNGIGGYNGDGITATTANLWLPIKVKVDGSGNIFIAEEGSNRIRKVTASTGMISTVAGNGANSHNGDGGLATSASLETPHGVAVDVSGNVYVTERRYIRKINSSGVISSIGGNGSYGYNGEGLLSTLSSVYAPSGITVNSAGKIYFSDEANSRVRVICYRCPAYAGSNKTNFSNGICCPFPGVIIGAPAVPNMTYSWSPSTALNSANIAQPTSHWTNTQTPIIYAVTVSGQNCYTHTSNNVTVNAAYNWEGTCCNILSDLDSSSKSKEKINFSVYPNPSHDNVTITLYRNADYIRIIDMHGKVVFESRNIIIGLLHLDISNYTKGIYMITSKMGNIIEKQKLVIE